jgi:hypothetical protein
VVAGVGAAVDVVGAEMGVEGAVPAAIDATDSRAVAELASALLATTGVRKGVDGASGVAAEDDCRVAPTWLSQPLLNRVTPTKAATTANLLG